MPGYSTSTGSTQLQSNSSKRQQLSGEDVGLSQPKKQPEQNKRRCSPASTLAAAGAKRKRSEAGTSACHDSQNLGSNSPHTTGIAPGRHPGNVARSDQQKARKSPARPSAKPSKTSKKGKTGRQVVDSEYDPDDEVPLYTLAQKQKQKIAALLSRQSNSREQANGVSAASRQRNAAAAASAAGFLGGGPKTNQGKPAAPSTGRLGASELSPSRGLTDLASRMFNPSRRPEPGLPPKPPTSHYDIYKNLSDQACRNQETQLSLAEAPFHDAAKSGVASFAYFEPGFLTSPFSVSAFAAESRATMSELEQFVAAASATLDSGHHIEAASLRVTPLEERQQVALQASIAEAEKAGADKDDQQFLRQQHALSKRSSGAAAKHARTSRQPPGRKKSHPPNGPVGVKSCRSGLMLPPPPRPPSKPRQASAKPSSSDPCSSERATSQGLSLALLPAAPDLPQVTLQLRQHSAVGAKHLLVDAPPLVPSPASISAPRLENAAAAALSIRPGLPSETAAVAAASDALIATFSAAGTGTHPKAPAAAAAAATTAGSSINASATDSSEMPHVSPAAQTGAAPPNAAALSQAQEQPQQGGMTGLVSGSAQPEAVAVEDMARQPGVSEQPSRDAAAASGPAQSSPAPRAVGDAGPPQDIDYGRQGRAALAAMPKIGPDSDDEDVSCVNMRYRPRTILPVKTQTKEQIQLQQKMSQEVRRKWLQESQDAGQNLTSLSMAQEIKTGAARKRWDRNIAVESASRLTSAEAFAQRAQRSLQGQGRAGSLAEVGNGTFLATHSSQVVGIPPLPNDTVLTFTVHRFDRPGKVLATVAVLGRQRLTVLRDTIKCEADATLTRNDISRPSACFYFEGAFFNDMRDESAVDMSYTVRDFCHKHSIKVPPPAPDDPPGYPPSCSKPAQDEKSPQSQPRAHKMEETTFDDLFLRVGQGAGYVYMHQGCCEHLVELSDVRSIHHAELLQSQPTSYPLVLKEAIRHRRDCKMCKMANIDRRAEWVTHNDRNAPTDPAFWCGDCYRQMHEDEGGDACYNDYKKYSYTYEYGNLKQNQGRPGSAESAPDETDDL